MDWLTDRPIAHRGLHDAGQGRPENSRGAFQAAVQARFPIELDVRLSADQEMVVFHDDTLQRLTGHPGGVHECRLPELRALRLAGTHWAIPTMGEVLDEVGGAVPILIELKNNDAPGVLEERLASLLRQYPGPHAVQSFNPLSLGWFTQHEPDILRGQLSGSFSDSTLDEGVKTLLRDISFSELNNPHFIGYQLSALPHPPVSAARAAGRPVIAWTIRTPAEAQLAATLADNFIFEGFLPGGL